MKPETASGDMYAGVVDALRSWLQNPAPTETASRKLDQGEWNVIAKGSSGVREPSHLEIIFNKII